MHLSQEFERQRMDLALRMTACAVAGKAALPEFVEDRLAQNAARRIAGAQEQDVEVVHAPRHRLCVTGFWARTKALMILPSTAPAIASTSTPLPVRNARASSTR